MSVMIWWNNKTNGTKYLKILFMSIVNIEYRRAITKKGLFLMSSDFSINWAKFVSSKSQAPGAHDCGFLDAGSLGDKELGSGSWRECELPFAKAVSG
jgi:hypothetical protein